MKNPPTRPYNLEELEVVSKQLRPFNMKKYALELPPTVLPAFDNDSSITDDYMTGFKKPETQVKVNDGKTSFRNVYLAIVSLTIITLGIYLYHSYRKKTKSKED
jgi:hypothetical protein